MGFPEGRHERRVIETDHPPRRQDVIHTGFNIRALVRELGESLQRQADARAKAAVAFADLFGASAGCVALWVEQQCPDTGDVCTDAGSQKRVVQSDDAQPTNREYLDGFCPPG